MNNLQSPILAQRTHMYTHRTCRRAPRATGACTAPAGQLRSHAYSHIAKGVTQEAIATMYALPIMPSNAAIALRAGGAAQSNMQGGCPRMCNRGALRDMQHGMWCCAHQLRALREVKEVGGNAVAARILRLTRFLHAVSGSHGKGAVSVRPPRLTLTLTPFWA